MQPVPDGQEASVGPGGKRKNLRFSALFAFLQADSDDRAIASAESDVKIEVGLVTDY